MLILKKLIESQCLEGVNNQLLLYLFTKSWDGFLSSSSRTIDSVCLHHYRKHHSTGTALLKVQTDILKALDNGMLIALVMIDLSAAFDTIDNEILLE